MGQIQENLILTDSFTAAFTRFLNLGESAVRETSKVSSTIEMMGKSSNYIAATGFNALEQKLQDINGQIKAQGEALQAIGKASNYVNVSGFDQMTKAIKESNAALVETIKNQEQLGRKTQETDGHANNLLKTMRNIAATAGVTSLVKGFLELSDSQTQINARLNLMKDATHSVAQLNDLIYQSALRSRAAYSDTADTIYDQLRYLKAKASYAFTNMSLEQIIMRIAGDFGLKVGTLDPTGYVFPSLLKENEECIDIIFDALSQTIIQTGKIFIFYDKAGELTLTEVNKMFLTSRIGDGSLATDYTYKRDIDSDTYNRVKLVRKNEKSGRTDVYVHEDTETIKQWGLLQYYDEVDKSLNEAQIDQMCAAYLQYYNRVLQTLKLEAIGLVELRAGMIVPVQLGDIEDLASIRLLLCEKVTHKWSGEDHTMQFEVKSFDQLGGINIV